GAFIGSSIVLLEKFGALAATLWFLPAWYGFASLQKALDRRPASACDHVRIDNGHLTVRRSQGTDVIHQDDVDLAAVVAAHAVDDQVRLDLNDGRVVRIGDGLAVPEHVLRWVSRRIIMLAPPQDPLSRTLADRQAGDQRALTSPGSKSEP